MVTGMTKYDKFDAAQSPGNSQLKRPHQVQGGRSFSGALQHFCLNMLHFMTPLASLGKIILRMHCWITLVNCMVIRQPDNQIKFTCLHHVHAYQREIQNIGKKVQLCVTLFSNLKPMSKATAHCQNYVIFLSKSW